MSHLKSVIADLELAGKVGEVTTLAAVPDVAAKLVVLAGVGALSSETGALEDVRKGIGGAIRSLSKKKKVAVIVPGTSVEVVSAVAEGVALGAYAVSKAGTTSTDAVGSIALVGPADAASRKVVKRAAALGEAVAYTRDLVNLPPNLLYPETFVDSLADRVKGTKVKLKSYDMKALRAGGFGGTVGVGQGSAERAEDRGPQLCPGPAQGIHRVRRQGHHVRLGRPLHQACERHADDEVRHGRGRRGRGRRPGHRRARSAHRRHRLPRPGREHAELDGAAPERRRDDARRQDRRGAQHRRRGAHGPR